MIYGIRFRHIDGLVILQVLEKQTKKYDRFDTEDVWRDAQVEDMLEISTYCKPYASLMETRLESIEQRVSYIEMKVENDS